MKGPTLPSIQEPFFFDPDRNVNYQVSRIWWIFFNQLVNFLGGSGSTVDLSAILALIQELNDNINDVSSEPEPIDHNTAIAIEELVKELQGMRSMLNALKRDNEDLRGEMEGLRRMEDLRPRVETLEGIVA